MTLATDSDLADLAPGQARQIVEARLRAYSAQLYESLLNKAHAQITNTDEGQLREVDKLIAGLRKAVQLHRDELAGIDAAEAADEASDEEEPDDSENAT